MGRDVTGKVAVDECTIRTKSDWERRKATNGRCGVYRFHREVKCCANYQPCCIEFWQQGQEACTLNCFEESNAKPGKLEGNYFYASLLCQPWFIFAGTITSLIGLGGCFFYDSCYVASWILSCGYCCSTPVNPRVRTILSSYQPIEPIALSILNMKERSGGTYTMHYSEERPCVCAHCCTCYDDLTPRLPVDAILTQDESYPENKDCGLSPKMEKVDVKAIAPLEVEQIRRE